MDVYISKIQTWNQEIYLKTKKQLYIYIYKWHAIYVYIYIYKVMCIHIYMQKRVEHTTIWIQVHYYNSKTNEFSKQDLLGIIIDQLKNVTYA